MWNKTQQASPPSRLGGKPKPKRGRTSGGGQQQQQAKPAQPQQQQQQGTTMMHTPERAATFSDDDDAADVDAQMEQVIKEMQLFNLFKTPPPMHFVFLCKECRTAMFFDRQKVRLVGNDQTEMRTKMCALCRKGNMELRRIFAQYWPYRP